MLINPINGQSSIPTSPIRELTSRRHLVSQNGSGLTFQQPLKKPSFGDQALEVLKNVWGACRSYFSCDRADAKSLVTAIREGDRGLVRGLLFRGVDPNQADENGVIPLLVAYDKNDVPMVLRLLKGGAKQPILCKAIREGKQSMASALIESEMVDLNAAEEATEMTPLFLAYRAGDFELMQLLMRRGARCFVNDHRNLFHKAVQDEKSGLALKFLEEGLIRVDPASEEDQAAFVKAMSFENGALIEAMIEKGFSPNTKDAEGLTPLSYAFQNGNRGLALALARHGAEYVVVPQESDPVNLLLQAVKNGWNDVALELLNNTSKMLDENGYLIRTKAHKPDSYAEKRANAQAGYLNFRDADGKTALQHACEQGQEEVALALIKAGAHIEETLQVACRKGLSKVIEVVLAKGVSEADLSSALVPAYQAMHEFDLAVRAGEGSSGSYYQARNLLLDLIDRVSVPRSLLHLAAADGDVEVVQAVIARGCDLLATDETGKTPCRYALMSGHMEVAAFLTSKGGLSNYKDLFKLDQGQYNRFVSALLTMRHPDGRFLVAPMQFLHRALKFNDATLVSALITASLENSDNIAKKDKKERSLADYALMSGDYDRAVRLKRAGSPLNSDLVFALTGPGFRQAVMSFITPDPETGKYVKPQKFIFAAALKGDAVLLKALIHGGADPKAYNDQHMTPIHIAAAKGHVEAVQALIEAGVADDIVTSDTGSTPLHLALQGGKVETYSYLISKSRKLEKGDTKGRTPLHLAALSGDVHAIAVLLDAGANINAPSATGLTPLHVACAKGHYEAIKSLIDRGASQNALSKAGKRPAQLISEDASNDIRKLLNLPSKGFVAIQNGISFIGEVLKELNPSSSEQ